MPIYLPKLTAIENQASKSKNRRIEKYLGTVAMASTQCYKPVEQTCYQGQYYEYDSSVAHKTHATQPSLVKTQTQYTTKTQAYYGETQTNNPSPNNGYGYGHPHSQSHGNYVEQTKAHGSTTPVCVDQNKVHGHGQGHGHLHAHSSNSNGLNVTAATASGCHGNGSKRRGVPRRRSLLQKLKDGLSGGDSSSSSSDSESDGEHSSRRSTSHC